MTTGLAVASLVASVASGAPPAENAPDGLRVEVELFEGGGEAPSRRATVWASGRRVRIEQRGPGGEIAAPTFVYRGDRDRLYSIADAAQSYVEIEPMLLSLLIGQTRVARREVSGSLEGLPADQQRAFGHLLGVEVIDPNRSADPLVVTRTAKAGSVAGLACQLVTLSRSNQLLAKGCVADWGTVGLTPADVEVFRSLASLVHDAAGSRMPIPVELVPGQPLDLVVQFGGFPLFFERAGRHAGASAIRVASVEKLALSDGQFEVPEGYAARSGMSGLASFAGLLSIHAGRSGPGVPTASGPESGGEAGAVAPAAMDPASAVDEASEPAEVDRAEAAEMPRPSDTPPGRPAYRSIRLFDDAE